MANETQMKSPCFDGAADVTRGALIKMGILPNKVCHEYIISAIDVMLHAESRMTADKIYERVAERTGVNKLAVSSSIYRGVKEASQRAGFGILYDNPEPSFMPEFTSSEFLSMLFLYVNKRLCH